MIIITDYYYFLGYFLIIGVLI